MFLSLFFAQIEARRPVILVPGTYASQLQVKADKVDTKWYCPTSFDWTTIWVDEKYFVPPKYNCPMTWFLSKYDEEHNNATEYYDGLEIDTVDFGGLGGVTMIDDCSWFNTSFIPYYFEIVKILKENNFVEGESLFGAPNDWRYGIAGQPEKTFPRLKELVEKAYYINKAKVVLFGHSFGSFTTHYFLDAMDQDWIDKYIDHAVLLAPSFTGAGETLYIAWQRALKFGNFLLNMTAMRNLLENIGAVHTHFPNYVLHGDKPVVYGPNGEEYYPNQFISLLREKGRMSEENERLARLQEKYISVFPPKPKTRTVIVYNSALNTTESINLSSWDEGAEYSHNYGGGDGTIPASSVEKYCKEYANGEYKLECMDINMTEEASHYLMLMNPDLVDLYYRLIRD